MGDVQSLHGGRKEDALEELKEGSATRAQGRRGKSREVRLRARLGQYQAVKDFKQEKHHDRSACSAQGWGDM